MALYHVDIVEGKIDIGKAYDAISLPSAGAIASFVGITRNTFEGRAVETLEYTAAIPIAVAMMRKMCDEANEHVGGALAAVWMVHRIGIVPVGEASIAIFAASGHRAEALAAVRFLIEAVKARLPVWKKEIYADGGAVWKENKEAVQGPIQ